MDLSPVHDLLAVDHPLPALRVLLSFVETRHSTGNAQGLDSDASSTLLRAAGEIHRTLARPCAEQTANWRLLPELGRRLEGLRRGGPALLNLAANIHDALQTGSAIAARRPSLPSPHVLALLVLVDFGVGLPLPMSWQARTGLKDDGSTELQSAGKQQVDLAAKVIMGLSDRRDLEALRASFKHRRLLPMIRGDKAPIIEDASLGLPALLAMLVSRFKLRLVVGTAATGELDIKTLPTDPPAGQWTEKDARAYLDVEIKPVAGLAAKLRAALEHDSGIARIIVPEANRRMIEEDAGLMADVAASGVELLYVDRVGAIFESRALFEPTLYAPPLRTDPLFSEHDIPTVTRCAMALAAMGVVGLVPVLYYWLFLAAGATT